MKKNKSSGEEECISEKIREEVYTGFGLEFAKVRREGDYVYRSESYESVDELRQEDPFPDIRVNRRGIRSCNGYDMITVGIREVVLLEET